MAIKAVACRIRMFGWLLPSQRRVVDGNCDRRLTSSHHSDDAPALIAATYLAERPRLSIERLLVWERQVAHWQCSSGIAIFWPSRSAPLYTRRPSAWAGCIRRPCFRLPTPSAGFIVRSHVPEATWFWGISRTPLPACAVFRQTCSVALAARQPVGTGRAQIRRSIDPNRRRVRWLSASNSQ